jgi:hypothetical protein
MNASNNVMESQANIMGGSSGSFAASTIFTMTILSLHDWALDGICKLERRIRSLRKRHENDEQLMRMMNKNDDEEATPNFHAPPCSFFG